MVKHQDKEDLSTLHRHFVTAAKDRPRAQRTLNTLYQAADALKDREKEFNTRQREGAHSLMRHLRDADHFTAMRTFNKVKAELDTPTGREIVKLVEKDLQPGQ